MQIDTSSLIKERKSDLPDEVRQLIDMETVSDVVDEVRNNFRLTKRQASLLENEVLLVLTFFLPRRGFVERIGESMEINFDLAERINDYIQTELYDLVEDYLLAAENYFGETMDQPGEGVVKPLRTMDSDAKNIHGYGINRTAVAAEEAVDDDETLVHSSSQDSLMPKPKEVIGQPPATPTTETKPEADTSK